MRSEFYPFFSGVLATLIDKLDQWRTDSDMLEKLFESLSYMFKYLQKHLVKDLKNVFDFFVKFFTNSKHYVREFASESFSFLMRKLPENEIREHVAHFCAWLDRDGVSSENLTDGLSLLFFNTVKGTKDHLNSSLLVMLRSFLDEMIQSTKVGVDPSTLRFRVLVGLMQRMRKHLVNAENTDVWDLLRESLRISLQASSAKDSLSSQFLTKLMSEWTRNKFHSTKTKSDSLTISCNMMRDAVCTLGEYMNVSAHPALLANLLELLSILLKTLTHLESRGATHFAFTVRLSGANSSYQVSNLCQLTLRRIKTRLSKSSSK